MQALLHSAEYGWLSPEERLERLVEFARRNPAVSIAAPLAEVRRALLEERQRQARAREVAEELDRWVADNARRAEDRRRPPSYMVSGGTTVYFVRPWTFAEHFDAGPAWLDRAPDCRARAGLSRASSPAGTWPYNFGMGAGGPCLGPRSPGMGW